MQQATERLCEEEVKGEKEEEEERGEEEEEEDG